MFERVPAIKFCLPLIFGILLGWHFSLPLFFIVPLLIVLGCGACFIWLRDPKSVYLAPLFIIILIGFGIFKITIDGKHTPDTAIGQFVNEDERTAMLMGTIVERALSRQKYYSMVIEAQSLSISGKVAKVEGGVLVSIPGDSISQEAISHFDYGRKIILSGVIQLPSRARNPGEFDYRSYLHLRGIYAQFRCTSERDITPGEKEGSWLFVGLIHPLRDWISATLDKHVGGEEGKLLKGLVIGERGEMAPEVKAAFTNAGLMHILAVSGLNVGLVAFMFWSVFSMFRFHKIVIGLLTIASLLLFTAITGAEASVVRATLMAIVFIGEKLFERKTNLYNVVGFAALAILVFDARKLFDIGFQLSFIAVLALAYIYPKLEGIVAKFPKWMQANGFIKKYLFLSTAVSLAATLGTLPLTIYYFLKVSIVGIVMNLLAVPLSGALLTLGCMLVLAASISGWLASVYGSLVYALAWFLLTITEWAGNLPFSVIEMNIDFPFVPGMFMLLVVVAEFHLPVVRRYAILGALLLGNIVLYKSFFAEETNILKITLLDVGQGDATLIELPEGKTILLDAGPRNLTRDAGERVIVPLLKRKGIQHIDALMISHPHTDHLGGAPTLLRAFSVGCVYLSGSESQSMVMKEVNHLLDSLKIPSEVLREGTRLVFESGIRLYSLHSYTSNDSFQRNFNNHSLVLKLVYGKTSMLFCGDAEKPVEEEIIRSYNNFLDSDLIKVGHHGSNTSSSKALLEKVTPTLALISVGQKNKFNHPSIEVLNRYSIIGCEIARTDKQGAIVVESDGNVWLQKEWRDD